MATTSSTPDARPSGNARPKRRLPQSPQAQRRQPQRSCVVCRGRRDQRDLTRLALADGAVLIDERRRAPGRGAYLCDSASCWEQAGRGDALARALRTRLGPSGLDAVRAAASDVVGAGERRREPRDEGSSTEHKSTNQTGRATDGEPRTRENAI